MQLSSLAIEDLHIPFKISFQHSSAVREKTESILVRAETKSNIQGIGEGCPRHYVTGETLETAHAFFNQYHSDFMNIENLQDLKNWIQNHQIEIDKNPAAFCAVELALLDVLAKQSNQSVERVLALPELSGEFLYTGVLGAKKIENFQRQLQQYLHLGFTDFKIKIFGEPEIDRANIMAIKKSALDNIRIRLDANNLWSNWREATEYIKMLDYPFMAVEEPLSVHQHDDCRKIFEALGTRIILDESFTQQEDFAYIKEDPEPWIINIRISKMGGIIRSLAIAAENEALNIPIIIGAQVGETSLLTRAALTVANHYQNILIAQEGAFGTYLLEHDVIEAPINFGRNGILQADKICTVNIET